MTMMVSQMETTLNALITVMTTKANSKNNYQSSVAQGPTLRHFCYSHERVAAVTHQQINRLIYELYDLTDDLVGSLVTSH